MIYAIGLALLVCAIAGFKWSLDNCLRDWSGAVLGFSVIAGIVGCVVLIMPAVNAAETTGQIAQIEQLRSDVTKAPCIGTDVIGQVTDVNQIIRANQRYNHTWYAGAFTPDAWDAVDVISVEVCK